MPSDANATQTLTQLGLTVLEARIYLALCKYKSLTTKEVSKLTKTSQSDIYRVIAKLQEKGLIEKIIEKPMRFKAVPIETSIAFLLERKKIEYDGLKASSKLLLRAFKEKPERKTLETNDSEFALIPQRETVVARIREAIEESKKTVDLYLSWKRFLNGITVIFADSCERAWARGVKFRFVVERPEKGIVAEQALQFCGKSPFCNIRFLPGCPKTVIGVYDKKEVFIIVNPKEGLFGSPSLWSNNQSLISVVQDYFDILWLTAIEGPNP